MQEGAAVNVPMVDWSTLMNGLFLLLVICVVRVLKHVHCVVMQGQGNAACPTVACNSLLAVEHQDGEVEEVGDIQAHTADG